MMIICQMEWYDNYDLIKQYKKWELWYQLKNIILKETIYVHFIHLNKILVFSPDITIKSYSGR